jgi:hypothetical protein
VLLVHHVHDHQGRRLLLLEDLPHHFGADLGAGVGAQHEDRGIGRRQRAIDVAHEVGEARRVEQIHLVACPFELRESQADRDLALDFVRGVVEQRVAVGDPAQAGGGLGVEQHRLGEAGLAHPMVSDKSDVADVGGREFLHKPPPRSRQRCVSEFEVESSAPGRAE